MQQCIVGKAAQRGQEYLVAKMFNTGNGSFNNLFYEQIKSTEWKSEGNK